MKNGKPEGNGGWGIFHKAGGFLFRMCGYASPASNDTKTEKKEPADGSKRCYFGYIGGCPNIDDSQELLTDKAHIYKYWKSDRSIEPSLLFNPTSCRLYWNKALGLDVLYNDDSARDRSNGTYLLTLACDEVEAAYLAARGSLHLAITEVINLKQNKTVANKDFDEKRLAEALAKMPAKNYDDPNYDKLFGAARSVSYLNRIADDFTDKGREEQLYKYTRPGMRTMWDPSKSGFYGGSVTCGK